ncbi:carbonyl reductase [NADPH] 1-like isoform X3 [Lissotriton helveticus]
MPMRTSLSILRPVLEVGSPNMANSNVAVVTGANKGIGLAIVRALCKRVKGDVYLTARDPKLGEASVKKLKEEEGLTSHFHQLDITNLQSITRLRDFLKKEYGGIDILINNAGIVFRVDDPTPFHTRAKMTLRTNFFATRNVCTELLPLMKPRGRVVNVSSIISQPALAACSKDLQQKFCSDTITEDELVTLMEKFVEDTKKGIHNQEGWPNAEYGVSKLGVNILSMILARKLNKEREADEIRIYACCPGWTQTDMGGDMAHKTPDEGAETPVYLALIPSDVEEQHGTFNSERKVLHFELPEKEDPYFTPSPNIFTSLKNYITVVNVNT